MSKKKAVGIKYRPDFDLASGIMREPAENGGYLISARVGESKITYGAVIPQKHPTSQEYLLNYRDYNSMSSNIKKQIKLSRKLYYWGNIIGTAVDTLVEFAVTPIRIYNVDDEKCLKMLDHFKNNVNAGNPNVTRGLNALINEISLEWFIAGNVFPYHNWRDVTIEGSRKTYEMPNNIPLLNPDNIELDKVAASVGVQIIKMEIPPAIQDIVRRNSSRSKLSEEETIIYDNVSEDIRKLVRKNKYEVILSPEKVKHIKRKGRSFSVWGVPYLTRCFPEFATKQKIKALDTATIDGLINRITIFLVGDKDNPTTWAPERLAALHSLLSSPNPSNMLVWGYDLDVKDVGPDGHILEFKNRYDQADYDILAALGVPLNLFIGVGKERAGTDPFITLMAMVEKLEKMREQLQVYLEDLLAEICERNGFNGVKPKIRWQRMNLRNIKELRTLVLSLHDRGLLPIQTTLEESNYDFEEMLRLRKAEVKDGTEDAFQIRPLPYQGPAMNQIGQKPSDKNKDPGRPEKDNEKDRPVPDTKDKKEDQRERKSDGVVDKSFEVATQTYYNDVYDSIIEQTVSTVQDGEDVDYVVAAGAIRIGNHIRTLLGTLVGQGKTVSSKTSRCTMFIGSELDRLASDIVDEVNTSDKTEGSIREIFDDHKMEFQKIIGAVLMFTSYNDINSEDISGAK